MAQTQGRESAPQLAFEEEAQADYSDCMPTIKLPWQSGFREEVIRNGWRHIGINPFTRAVYWDLLLEEAQVASVVGEAEDAGFDAAAIDWRVMFGDNFSDSEEDGDLEEAPKSRLTSGDLAFNGPANNATNRAFIRAKKQEKQQKAEEKAEKA